MLETEQIVILFKIFLCTTDATIMYCYCWFWLFIVHQVYGNEFANSLKLHDESYSITSEILTFCKMNGKRFLTITTLDHGDKQVTIAKHTVLI